MPLYEFNSLKPHIGEGTWVAPTASVIGNVSIGGNCHIGFGAVIRGDFGAITIGDETVVEDNSVIHTASRTIIGNRVIIGHMAMIHDATIDDEVLIGMQAMICEGAIIRRGAFIAEQTLVLKNQKIPPNKIYAGSPAECKKDVSEQHRDMFDLGVQAYIELTQHYHETFKTYNSS